MSATGHPNWDFHILDQARILTLKVGRCDVLVEVTKSAVYSHSDHLPSIEDIAGSSV